MRDRPAYAASGPAPQHAAPLSREISSTLISAKQADARRAARRSDQRSAALVGALHVVRNIFAVLKKEAGLPPEKWSSLTYGL